MTIRTTRLRLEPALYSDLLAVGLGDAVLAETLGVAVAPDWAGHDAMDAIERTRDRLADDPALAQWSSSPGAGHRAPATRWSLGAWPCRVCQRVTCSTSGSSRTLPRRSSPLQ